MIMQRPRSLRSVVPAALAVMVVMAAVTPAAALHPHERDGWMLGLSYGPARGNITFGAGLDESVEIQDGVSPQIRLGHSLGRHFSVGASYAGWMYETGVVPVKFRLSLQNILAAVTWYPGDPTRSLGGFYVRGGVGLAWTRITGIELHEDEEQGHGEHLQESGLGFEITLGYEFRVTHNAAFGMSLGAHGLNIQGDIFKDASFAPFVFTGAWYW
ncbi:hypothetical protein DRQ50_10115 [bacterium]|nr:MAG: hypothetical protein DRQ50_10115 [bacterium]